MYKQLRLRGCSLFCNGPSGTSENVLWADESAIIESKSILYSDIGKPVC